MTVVCFALMTVALTMALVESYFAVSAGVLFLGFGGSKWTVDYVQRYIGLCVNIGIKLLVIQLLIAVALTVTKQFLVSAAQVSQSVAPMLEASDILGSCIILTALVLGIPKLISTMIGGSPQMSGGDIVGATVGAGTAVGTVAGLAASGVAAGVAKLSGGTGGAIAAGGASAPSRRSAASATCWGRRRWR